MKKCCDMKGFLSFSVLRLISKKSMSGEEIRDELEKRRGTRPSAGTVYPVLKSLKMDGFIEEIKVTSKEKRYKLTEKGNKELKIATEKFIEMFYDLKEDFKKCS